MELLLGEGGNLYASLRNKLEKWSYVLSSEGLHPPTSPIASFRLLKNLSPKWIVPTDNKLDDNYSSYRDNLLQLFQYHIWSNLT